MKLTEKPQDYQALKAKLGNRNWRLNNLYSIKNKDGKKVKFKPNDAQKDFLENMWYYNVILKARQLGFSTLILIYFLDACLFNSNHSAGVIAQTQNDTEDLFNNKVKFAYDNLPEWLKKAREQEEDSAKALAFDNGSRLVVGVSLRGGTYQKLHVSEYGKIGAKDPLKAKEIKTGAFNTLTAGQQIFVESTAEGKTGEFYDLCQTARKLTDSGKPLARIQPKFFFYNWTWEPRYAASPEEIKYATIKPELRKYFRELEEQHGIFLTDAQKAWYCLKQQQQTEDMQQEFPSTPEEAFESSLKGAYYTQQMRFLRQKGFIGHVPYDPRYPVYTWWDLGLRDLMSIWFHQFINEEHRFIDYHQSSGQGWDFYAKLLTEKGYNYARHNFPHDGNKRVRHKQVITDMEVALECGIRPIIITPRTDNAHNEVINVCQPILVKCKFDAENCAEGLDQLDNYRRVWNKQVAEFEKKAVHDDASHGADAFRTFAANADDLEEELREQGTYDNFGPQTIYEEEDFYGSEDEISGY